MKTMSYWIVLIVLGILFIWIGCKQKTKEEKSISEVKNVEWVKNAVIYEVNIRQYTPEGTFKAFATHLPRLKSMGIDILWIMPIHPIGEKNRKGSLGSYYSVRDYRAINPEFGTIDDFKQLVKEIHAQGMKVIIDWVPNHSAWDNPLTKTNPDFYMKDSAGNFVSPFDWTDVIRFDYSNPQMRSWMVETMKYWLIETDIDGFRCDVAHMVPVEFWDSCRVELDKVKPIFFLAEADQPFLHKKAFDMSYDWRFHHLMNEIAKGKKHASDIEKHFAWVDSIYPAGSILMQFTSNHDENSWNGTEFERLDGGAQTFAVLAATVPGMLLIYNGQEAAFNRRLKFFEKDSISWDGYVFENFYRQLIGLKKSNPALWNGSAGGSFRRVYTTDSRNVIVYVRQKENNQVVVMLNLTPKPRTIMLREGFDGKFIEAFTNTEMYLSKYQKFSLAPWSYYVWVSNQNVD
ncbi:MAG: alpha-amylase family glycosyl hydrolase [Bacteroidales bacterium]|nr:alpha-amylase family glycosyl hydrolase [Bacteroidales bacterium]